MDKKLLIEAGLELVMALIRGGLSFARTLGVSDEQLDKVLGPGGAYDALIQARESGKIRWIGITGHSIPAVDSPRRPGDAPRLVASADKIQQEIGWRPQFPDLEQIIASAWEWHSSHPNGYA